jgi:hypothetical protein
MDGGRPRKSPPHEHSRGRGWEKERPVYRKTPNKANAGFEPRVMSELPPEPKSAADSKSPTAQNELPKKKKHRRRKKPPTQMGGTPESANGKG